MDTEFQRLLAESHQTRAEARAARERAHTVTVAAREVRHQAMANRLSIRSRAALRRVRNDGNRVDIELAPVNWQGSFSH